MTHEMEQCAAEIRKCWLDCDAAIERGDSEQAGDAFGRAFSMVDGFPAIQREDVLALKFLCVLTWVKVASALKFSGQEEAAHEAREQVFALLDEAFPPLERHPQAETIEALIGLASEESAVLVGGLYLLCNEAGRPDSLTWGRCFLEYDNILHSEAGPVN